MAAFKIATAALLIACLFVALGATSSDAAVTCSTVATNLNPCINYLKGTGGAVPAPCCSGIKTLASAASSTPDRQAACRCLKSAANSIKGINYKLAAGLPSSCGVNIPYKISPSTDCNLVK